MAVPLAGHMGAQSGSVAQLARLSPRNAASHFGASIEQALASVESRLKRLEEHSNVASLEQALKTAEARIQRLERERESQAQIYERVDSLVSTRVEELRRNVNRSLEVIVDKVKSETEQLHTDFRSQEAKLRKDLAVDARVLKDLEASLNEVMEETKAAREVSTRLSAIEEVLSLLTANVNSLPSFLWQMELSVTGKRRSLHHREGATTTKTTAAAAAAERGGGGGGGGALWDESAGVAAAMTTGSRSFADHSGRASAGIMLDDELQRPRRHAAGALAAARSAGEALTAYGE